VCSYPVSIDNKARYCALHGCTLVVGGPVPEAHGRSARWLKVAWLRRTFTRYKWLVGRAAAHAREKHAFCQRFLSTPFVNHLSISLLRCCLRGVFFHGFNAILFISKVWMDLDAVFARPDENLEELLDSNFDLHVTHDFGRSSCIAVLILQLSMINNPPENIDLLFFCFIVLFQRKQRRHSAHGTGAGGV
jgi:hypothetical protein